jgi:hypothetical protein
MPEYVMIVNDPDTYPKLAFNERIVNEEFFPIYDNRVHSPEQGHALLYTRIRLTTEYFYDWQQDRPDATHYYGMLAGTLPDIQRKPSSNYYGFLAGTLSPGQDMTSTPGVGQIPKTPGGTKSSRAGVTAQTLKAFWSNGKPKCRKGYRYDFKRKMCVKKS